MTTPRRPPIWIILSTTCIACSSGLGLFQEVRPQAAKDFGCAEDEVEIQAVERAPITTLNARGCSKSALYVKICGAGVDPSDETCEWAQSSKLKRAKLEKRIAFDMQCAIDKVAITELSAANYGVMGCGRRVTYVWNCPHAASYYSANCTWVLNTESVTIDGTKPRAPAAKPEQAEEPSPTPKPAEKELM